MANEALIEALERGRDRYSQRQRTVNGLLTALKGTTGALGKAARALNDYAAQNDGAPSAALLQARQGFGDARLRETAIDPLLPELRREVKTLTTLVAALRESIAALRGEAVDVVKLGRASGALRALRLSDSGLVSLLPELEQTLQVAQRGLGDTFGQALRTTLAEQGLELGGRPPRFELGRFEISADFVNRRATISYGKESVAAHVPLSVEAVLRAYQREAKAITGRNEDGDRWMEQAYAAWQRAFNDRPNAASRANIVDVYFELTLVRQARSFHAAPSKKAFIDYSRAQFAYDLQAFAVQQQRAASGKRLVVHHATKSQTDSNDRSMWIVHGPGPHDGHFMGDLQFSEG